VGKTVAIDENTRFNPEYVRVKIACKDILEVPESAEGNLGMYIFDFFYELEEADKRQLEKQKSAVRTEDQGAQPNPKKMKTGHNVTPQGNKNSTPGKVDTARKGEPGTKMTWVINISQLLASLLWKKWP
jgi:hypothetical protein